MAAGMSCKWSYERFWHGYRYHCGTVMAEPSVMPCFANGEVILLCNGLAIVLLMLLLLCLLVLLRIKLGLVHPCHITFGYLQLVN